MIICRTNSTSLSPVEKTSVLEVVVRIRRATQLIIKTTWGTTFLFASYDDNEEDTNFYLHLLFRTHKIILKVV